LLQAVMACTYLSIMVNFFASRWHCCCGLFLDCGLLCLVLSRTYLCSYWTLRVLWSTP